MGNRVSSSLITLTIFIGVKMKHLINILKGAAIGVGMIIPGVSGGTIAVLLNIYEGMIEAISNLKKILKSHFSIFYQLE